VSGGEGTPQDAGGFGDVHALGRFAEFPEVYVRQLGVVGDARIRGRLEIVESHGPVISVVT
jgi:hypothetical protein